jgi:hypothetical protein
MMQRRFWTRCWFSAVVATIVLGLGAGSVRAYTMQILNESYLCQAEAYYAFAHEEWSPERGFYREWTEFRDSQTGKYSASADAGGASASANISRYFSDNIQRIYFGNNGYVRGNVGDPMSVSNSSEITGKVEFMITKNVGDTEDTVGIPFQIYFDLYNNGYGPMPRISADIILNGTSFARATLRDWEYYSYQVAV